jgi:hypothetical protein
MFIHIYEIIVMHFIGIYIDMFVCIYVYTYVHMHLCISIFTLIGMEAIVIDADIEWNPGTVTQIY